MTRVLLSKNIENLVRKDECKLHALQRIRKFFTVEKAKMLVNAFIDSHFNYAPLIWMFCRKTLHPKIEKIPHRTLKVCIDNSYNNILLRSNSVSIHQRQLHLFKSISQINPDFMWSFFKQKKLSYQCHIPDVFWAYRFLEVKDWIV